MPAFLNACIDPSVLSFDWRDDVATPLTFEGQKKKELKMQ